MKTKPDSPDLASAQVEIESTREQLRLETEKMIGSDTAQTAPLFYKRLEQKLRDAQKEADELKVREKNLQALVKDYEKKIETLPEQDRELALLTRDNEVNENIYKMLVLKVEENKLAAAEVEEKGTKYTILDSARRSLKPSKPEILLIGIVAFILGILSGFGCVFMAEFSDHSFRGVEDAKKFLKFEILGGVAAIVDRGELSARRARQSVTAVFVIILYIIFFIIGFMYSNMKEEEIKNKVIDMANKEKAIEAKYNDK